MTPRLRRVLDALEISPAFVKTPNWDIIAWNRAASKVLLDYRALSAEQHNILRPLFSEPRARALQTDWDSVARFAVASFRADATRAGASAKVKALVDELCRMSPEFEAMCHDNDVRTHGEGTKYLQHPVAGRIALEYSAFAVDGRPDLGLVIYNPATPTDADRVRSLIKFQPNASR